MKKCPKCGTVLDDSKTKCYMCGETLGVVGSVSFLDNIDNTVGATISNTQDNVFNNGKDIEVLDLGDVAKPEEPQTFVSHSGSTMDYYSSEINQLNHNDDSFNPFADSNQKATPAFEPAPEVNKSVENMEKIPIPAPGRPEKEPKEKKVKEKKKSDFKISKPVVFNSICFIIFMGLIGFAYFKFIRKPSNVDVRLGGLIYTIDPQFELVDSNEITLRSYTYGKDCTVNVYYGLNTDSDAVTKSLDKAESYFESDERARARREEISINGNKWTALNIDYFTGTTTEDGQAVPQTRYKYITILHNGNIFHIDYFNNKGETVCETMFEEFTHSLRFE